MKKSLSVSLATFLAFWQVGFALVPFLTTQTAYAANEITASNHEGQLKPSGSYSSGNITTYAELDYINYRFNLDSSAIADGQMQVRFSGVETTGQACTFFQQTFSLGTHDSSAASVVPVSGSTPTVSTVGTPTASGDEWVQVLDVDFAGAGQAVVNYYLTLTDEAGDCGGSSQHSRLNNVSGPAGGDFANIGAQNVPIPAKDIIELATITVTKYIDENGDGQSDRTATAGEWSFSLEGGTPVATNASGQVVFSNLQTGDYDINESGPADYSFISVNGENCVPGNLSGTAVASIIAAPTATDASCDFFNGIRPAHIIVQKETLPDGNQQSFAFTSNYGNGFNLSDGGSNDSGNLLPGTYSVSETVPSGWDLTNITCSDGSNPTSINLAAGETVTCVFTNTKRGHLIVQKTTLPSGDQTQFSILATGNGSITGGGSGTITDALDKDYEVTPGTYSVSETEPDGWTKTDNTCQDVVVAPGATAYCTITNRKKATLTIVKDALPADTNDLFSFTSTGGLSPAAFDLDDSASTAALDSKQFSLEPGDYSVTETVPTGWKLTELNCEGSDGFSWPSQTSRLEISLAAGDTVTCKFTNTKYGSISGFKFEVNSDGSLAAGDNTLADWTINLLLDDAFYSSSTTLGDGSYEFLNLLPGDYTVEEVNQDGWTQISDTEDCAENYEIGLLAGENSTDNNFCNFENGSLSGYKFEDKDADGNYEPGDGETKLPDWPFYFYYDEDDNGIFDEAPTPFTTDQDGNFSFDNLAPGEYQICENPQTALGWVRTTPVTSNCRTTEINISSESVTNLKFGNQGRGTIQVFKDVDTDGDGDIDEYGSSGWTWDLGSTNFATGSAAQNVAAGDYTVHEDQQTDYHFTGVVCTKSGEEYKITQAETTFVTVEPGDDIVCTFTNTRDTGTITVNKLVDPSDDDGYFDLQVDGTTELSDAQNGDTTGAVRVVSGLHNAGEIAGTSTSLENYDTSYECVENQESVIASGAGVFTPDFTVGFGDDIVCTFTNTRHGEIVVIKNAVPNDGQDFHFKIEELEKEFDLDDDDDSTLSNTETTEVSSGSYTITEDSMEGWDLADIYCEYSGSYNDSFGYGYSDEAEIFVQPGQTVTCVFTNEKRATVVVTKYNDYNRNGQYDQSETELPEPTLPDWEFNLNGQQNCEEYGLSQLLSDFLGQDLCQGYDYDKTQTTGADGTTTFTDVRPYIGHELSETLQDGWHLSNIHCSGDERGIFEDDEYYVYASPGETVECFVGNYRDPVLTIAKSNNRPNPTSTGDTVTYTITVSVPENSGAVFDAIVQDLPPEGFSYVAGSWTASSSIRGDLKAAGTTTEPDYGSPGEWFLGNMLPSEIVTLTYKALIGSTVSAGTYPDVAFAIGCDIPNTEGDCDVLSNVSTGADTPFVGTKVTINAPQVLGTTTTILVETGTAIWQSLVVGGGLLIAALATLARRPQKGGLS